MVAQVEAVNTYLMMKYIWRNSDLFNLGLINELGFRLDK